MPDTKLSVVQLVRSLWKQHACEAVILSDANSVFIDEILRTHRLQVWRLYPALNPAMPCQLTRTMIPWD